MVLKGKEHNAKEVKYILLDRSYKLRYNQNKRKGKRGLFYEGDN